MKKLFFFIIILTLGVTACNKARKIIAREELKQIYKEMLLADQWLDHNFYARAEGDTSCVYAAIFAKYGYTVDDYKASLDYYTDDITRFSRIFRDLTLDLQKDIENLELIQKEEEAHRKVLNRREDIRQILEKTLLSREKDFSNKDFKDMWRNKNYVEKLN